MSRSSPAPQSVKPPPAAPFWESAYATDARPFGAPSEEVLALLDRLPPRARVLDLGCGDGRNALPLAAAGCRVTAVDRSRAALDALRRASLRLGTRGDGAPGTGTPGNGTSGTGTSGDRTGSAPRPLAIEEVEADLAHMAPLDDYDLIVAHGVLHLLAVLDRDWVLGWMRRHTRPGGWNVVAVFTDALPPPPDLAPHCRGLFQPGELFLRYGDWDVELARSYILEDEHPGGIRHRHPIEQLVARRPTPGR